MQGSDQAYDICVIGAGMAGMAAALFAANRGLSTALCGSVGGIDFSSGPLDLMAVHPVAEKRLWDDPFAAIRALVQDIPRHPYALVGEDRIRAAMNEFCAGLQDMGLPYQGGDANVHMLTPAGTVKRTFRVPQSMWKGVAALERKAPCLLVGFKGLKGFSSRQIACVQQPDWPALRSVQLPFPRFRGELYVEHLALSLREQDTLHALARAVAPHVKDAASVGFPSALGLFGAGEAQRMLEQELGVDVFEIPTLPPSLAGLRLRASFEQHLPGRGVTVFSQQMARSCRFLQDGGLELRVAGQGEASAHGGEQQGRRVQARTAIHCGGRFFGKGLRAHRKGLLEPLFGLPVQQPESREAWHEHDFFASAGHAVNSAGLETDDRLRPLGANGAPAHEHLFAAGSILAHQDWMRMKCGAGLAIATALAAVEHACAALGRPGAPASDSCQEDEQQPGGTA